MTAPPDNRAWPTCAARKPWGGKVGPRCLRRVRTAGAVCPSCRLDLASVDPTGGR